MLTSSYLVILMLTLSYLSHFRQRNSFRMTSICKTPSLSAPGTKQSSSLLQETSDPHHHAFPSKLASSSNAPLLPSIRERDSLSQTTTTTTNSEGNTTTTTTTTTKMQRMSSSSFEAKNENEAVVFDDSVHETVKENDSHFITGDNTSQEKHSEDERKVIPPSSLYLNNPSLVSPGKSSKEMCSTQKEGSTKTNLDKNSERSTPVENSYRKLFSVIEEEGTGWSPEIPFRDVSLMLGLFCSVLHYLPLHTNAVNQCLTHS